MSAKIYCIVTKERLYHLEEARVEIRGVEIDSLWLDEAKQLEASVFDKWNTFVERPDDL